MSHRSLTLTMKKCNRINNTIKKTTKLGPIPRIARTTQQKLRQIFYLTTLIKKSKTLRTRCLQIAAQDMHHLGTYTCCTLTCRTLHAKHVLHALRRTEPACWYTKSSHQIRQ